MRSSALDGAIHGCEQAVEAIQPIYAGGALKNGIEASQMIIEAAVLNKKGVELDLVYQVEQVFYGAILATAMIEVIEDGIETADARYLMIKDFHKEGLVSNLDLLQVESAIASLDPKLIEAKNARELAMEALKILMDVDSEKQINLIGRLDYNPQPIPDIDQVYDQAMNNRPDVQSVNLGRDIAERGIKIVEAGYLPVVGGFANYQWNRGQELPPNDEIWRDGWQVGISLSQPVFDGGATLWKSKAAHNRLSQAEEGRRGIEMLVRAEAKAVVLDLKKAEEQIAAQKVRVDVAEENFEAAEERYRIGMSSNLEVMVAHTSVTQAKAEYLSAVHSYILAQANLRKVTGQGYKEEQSSDEVNR